MGTHSLFSRSSSSDSNLNHSVGQVLSKRAASFERAPRIKIGDQYYHVVRVVGGKYEAPLSNPRELEKATRIGKVYFSAHKKFAERSPELASKKIHYANQEGIRYDDGSFVRNDQVQLNHEDAIDYLKATYNFEWQEKVLDLEQRLDSLSPTDRFQGQVPSYLQRMATRTGNHGPYTVQQVKEFLLEYTQNKLVDAHQIYSIIYSNPEEQENQSDSQRQQIERFPMNATGAIEASRQHLQAEHLTTDHIWQMMVRTMQPAEYRLLLEQECLAHEDSPLLATEPISSIPQELETRHIRQESPPSSPAESHASRSSPRQSVVLPFGALAAAQHFEQKSSSPISRDVQQSAMRMPPRKLEFYEREDFRARGDLYLQLRWIASHADAHKWESRAAAKAACRSAHQKMERNADPGEYTTLERSAIYQVIQKRETAGGFGLLMNGTRYQCVLESLAFYAHIGLI
ncbi:MAG: hypothetical protein QNJ27_03895 [Simkaniaceae bacterium]|nr:hypothetical protein [Simkaniaceae bacterium]